MCSTGPRTCSVPHAPDSVRATHPPPKPRQAYPDHHLPLLLLGPVTAGACHPPPLVSLSQGAAGYQLHKADGSQLRASDVGCWR